MKRLYAFVPLLLAIVTVSIDGLRQSKANDILFQADVETGDLSQWTADHHVDSGWPMGGVWISGNGDAQASTDVAHSGNYSVALTVDGHAGVRMARRAVDPGPDFPDRAFYSVWFYFPQSIQVNEWWNVMQWTSEYRRSNGQGSSEAAGLVNVQSRSDGSLFFVYEQTTGNNAETGEHNIVSADINIPVGQWVQVECLYEWNTASGQVKCWQDDHLLWNLDGIPTEFDFTGPEYEEIPHHRQWMVNNHTTGTQPSRQTIYIDDAVVSLSRIGPGTPEIASVEQAVPLATGEPATLPQAAPQEPINLAAPGGGDTYYVSPSGSDNNPGTQAQPLRSLGRALQLVSAGETIHLASGTYMETVEFSKSGNAQDGYIRIIGESGAVVDGSNDGSNECIDGRGSYIWIENLEVRNCNREGIFLHGQERNMISNIVLRTVYVHDNGKRRHSWDHGISLEHIDTFEISGSTVNNNYADGIFVLNSQTGLIQNTTASYNNGSRNGTEVGYQNDSDGIHILNVRNTVIQNIQTNYNGEEGLDIGGWGTDAGNFSAPIDSYDVHVRNCVAHDNANSGISFSAEPETYEMDAFDLSYANCLVYNNGTRITDSADGASGLIGKARAHDVRIFNNIFSDNHENNILLYNNSYDHFLKNNILAFANFRRDNQLNTSNGAYGLYADYNVIWPRNAREELRGTHYIEQDPLFVNRQAADYTLQSNSPAINAGGPLTTTTNAGSGQTIQVEEAKWFHDGFGMTQGDTIQVNTQVAVIVDIPNSSTIVLDRSISWQVGDWVTLPYSGTAPTMGLASNISAEPPPPPPPTEEPTTPPPATEEPTTPPPATEEPTTPPPATEEPTTPPPATEEPTTPPPPTEEPTTPPPSTTEEPTTPPPSVTEEPTTPPPSATEEPTTPPPSTTEEPTTPPPSATEEPTTPPPSATEEATTAPSSATEEATSVSSSALVVTQAPTQPTPEPTTPPPSDNSGNAIPSDVQPPVALLGSDQTQLEPGQCTTIYWQTGRATDVRLNGTTVAKAGSQEVCPAISTKYTLDATGPGGQATAITVVEVVATALAGQAPVAEPVGVCENNVALEVNVTYPGSTVEPGTSLSTSWYIRNTGTCTWDDTYTVVFTEGEPMGAPYTLALPYAVDPGRTAVITVEMTAPAVAGEYHGAWQVKAGDGALFGQPLTADIAVTIPEVAAASVNPEPQGRNRTPIWQFWQRLFERFNRTRSRNMISGFFVGVEPQRMMIWMFVLMVGLILSLVLAVPPAWLMGRMRSRH